MSVDSEVRFGEGLSESSSEGCSESSEASCCSASEDFQSYDVSAEPINCHRRSYLVPTLNK